MGSAKSEPRMRVRMSALGRGRKSPSQRSRRGSVAAKASFASRGAQPFPLVQHASQRNHTHTSLELLHPKGTPLGKNMARAPPD